MLESRRIINEHISDPPSFIILLNEHDWTITPGRAQVAASKSLKHFSYADPAASILNDIDHRRIPVDFMDLFTKLKIPYYEGCLIVEVRDQRPKGRNNEPPLPEKIVLRPTAESINHDVKTNARESRWGDKEALELESRLLLATSAPLILDPDPSVNRMANIIARAAASPKKASLKRKVSEDSEEEHENAKRQKIMQVMKPVTKIPQTYAIADLAARRRATEQQNKQQQNPTNPANATPSQPAGPHAGHAHPRAPPAPMPIPQHPNGAANNAQANIAVYQAAMRQKLAQAGGLNGGVAGQQYGQPNAPLAPGVVPPSNDAIKNAIEIGQSAKGFPLKLPQNRKQSQSTPGTSGTPGLPMGQPSTAGQPNHNSAPHPSATPVPSHPSQSRPVGVPTMPLQNGNQAAANAVANFHGQNPQGPPMQQMLANPQFAAALGHNAAASMMGGPVARPASASQNHPPNGQMQPPQAGRAPQQVAQPGQHPQHAANSQLAAYLHAQQQSQQHPPQGQPSGTQPAQPHQVPLSLLAVLPPPYRQQLLHQKAQFPQLGPVEKQAWLEKWTDPQLKGLPDWHSKTDDEKANIVLNFKARQVIHQQRVVYAQNVQRLAGQVGIGQPGQGMMTNGMMPNGMMPNGMMPNGMMARMPGANPMAGMVGMPATGMPGMPGMMQNMGGMPLQNGMPGQLPQQ